ncbi:MAG: hypothetical protein IMZ66_00415 [Planctomycetes bacterium]|nr:hypothetical protein [Planctomycetota bacterium]
MLTTWRKAHIEVDSMQPDTQNTNMLTDTVDAAAYNAGTNQTDLEVDDVPGVGDDWDVDDAFNGGWIKVQNEATSPWPVVDFDANLNDDDVFVAGNHVDTAGTKTVVGFAAGEACTLGDVTITPANPFSALHVTAQGKGETIRAAKALLVVAMARVRNTGMVLEENAKGTSVKAKGASPMRREPMKAEVALRKAGAAKVLALDHDGRPTGFSHKTWTKSRGGGHPGDGQRTLRPWSNRIYQEYPKSARAACWTRSGSRPRGAGPRGEGKLMRIVLWGAMAVAAAIRRPESGDGPEKRTILLCGNRTLSLCGDRLKKVLARPDGGT